MIHPVTLKFLTGLKKNNHKEWIDAHRPDYDASKADFAALVTELIKGISGFDPLIAQAGLDAKHCVSRLNRDIRFSKDKTPYKTNFFAVISQGGKKSRYACYFVQVQPGKSFAGGGIYMPDAPTLRQVRQEIDYNPDEWKSILHARPFRKNYPEGIKSSGNLTRPPKGFEDSNPSIQYLKMKDYYSTDLLSDELILSKACIKTILQHFEALKPIIDFLNKALD